MLVPLTFGALLTAFAAKWLRRWFTLWTPPESRPLAAVLVSKPSPLPLPEPPVPGCGCPACQLQAGLVEAVRRGGVFVQDVPRGPRA